MTKEKITLEDLKEALENSWSKETSADSENWTTDNPTWGQCAITALIVQDYFGGKLIKAKVDKFGSHYWNKLPNGQEKDLTRSQFPKGVVIPFGKTETRKYVLSYPDTVKRYKILKQRVEKFLENKGEEGVKEIKGFDPIKLAEKIRPRMIDLENKKVLLASFTGVSQAKDIPERRIIGDYFRIKIYEKPEELEKGIHNFRQEPAGIAALRLKQSFQRQFSKKGLLLPPKIRECNGAFIAQVNGCNLRCWQCYVDDKNKSAKPCYGRFFSAEEILIEFLVESRKAQFLTDPDRKVNVLRLSGGDPFLVPEIIIWTIEAVEKFELQDYIYLWVDTNLATANFYWKYLTTEQKNKIRDFVNIGFMGCYKGFDEESFTKTCGAAPEFFKEQFKMHRNLTDEGLDVYSYLYPLVYSDYSDQELRECLANFKGRLQREVNILAPLRLTTPYTKIYSPTEMRLTLERELALKLQYKAIKFWKEEMKRRFGPRADLMPHETPVK